MLKVPILECWSVLPTIAKDGAGGGAAADNILHVEVVVGVGGLEPRAAVVEIEVHGVGVVKL